MSLAVTAFLQGKSYVLILVDDLGYMDIGAYNPKSFYETPNIDRFAGTSLRFTQAYAASPVCSPTRAAIMTGKHPARLNMTIWHEGARAGGPKNRRLLNAVAN
ncbi:MAG: sulfatase-like hydrolase/transferase, partial [Akkermansiaceae bacterium]